MIARNTNGQIKIDFTKLTEAVLIKVKSDNVTPSQLKELAYDFCALTKIGIFANAKATLKRLATNLGMDVDPESLDPASKKTLGNF